MQPPLSDRWERGAPYEAYVGRWSRRVAPRLLEWLGVGAGQRWLDVGCGTGALCAAIVDACAPSRVTGVDPSAGFVELARRHLGDRVVLHVAPAEALPLEDGSVDAAVSGLVLNFIPDIRAALAEMRRVVRPGGCIGGYVWDYADRMQMIRHFWDAAVELHPDAASLHEGVRFPLCRPDALRGALAAGGLESIDVDAVEVPTRFADFDDYWAPFLGAQGPAPAFLASLDAPARRRLGERLRERLPIAPDGSIDLVAGAWMFRATNGRAGSAA